MPAFEINSTEKQLLEITTRDLSNELSENTNALHVRMKAYDGLINGTEEVQVHILITRDKDDFLEDFQTEIMRGG